RPGYAKVHNHRAWVNSLRGKLDWALLDSNWAVELKPFLPAYHGTRGHVHFLMGCLDEALADFKESERLQPRHTFAIAGQAVCYQAMGKTDEARAAWARLLRKDKRYHDPEWLRQKWNCADKFVDESRKIVQE